MAQFGRPEADTYNGDGWTEDDGDTTNMFQEIDETSASDTDYVRSALAPTNDAVVFRFSDVEDPVSSSGHIVRWQWGKDAASGATITGTVELRQGYVNEGTQGTLIATCASAETVPDTFTADSYTLTGGEADAITDYTSLFIRIVANQA